MAWIKELSDAFRATLTGWESVEASGDAFFEAASTTHKPSMRTLMLVDENLDGNYEFLTGTEVDERLEPRGAIFEGEVPPGQAWVLRGQHRNAYMPGVESAAGQGFQVLEDLSQTSGFLPDGVTMESGHATLDGVDDGIVVRYSSEDVEYLTYKNDEEAEVRSLNAGEWDENPFSGSFISPNFGPSHFGVHRHRFDLYGAGESTLEIRLRTEDGAKLIKPVSVSTLKDPLLDVFNHPNSVRIVNESDESFRFGVGPKMYYNITNSAYPQRETSVAIRDGNVNHSLDSAEATVMAVFRLDPENQEVPITPDYIEIEESDAATGEIRLTAPQHLNWTGDFEDGSNWMAPPDYDVRDRATQMLDVAPGEVTINTFIDEDGQEKMRGHVVEQTYSSRAETTTAGETSWYLDKYRYFVLTARHRNSGEIELFDVEFAELW